MAEFIHQFFLSVGILSLISLFGGMFSAKLRQPAVIGLILVGTIVGPNVLGIVNDSQIMELLAELGATLLLFSIGVEFSISKVISQGIRAVISSSIVLFLMFITGYEIATIFGLDFITSIALGACFSFSSTVIFIRLMQAHNLINSSQVPFLVSLLVIDDIVAVFAMAFFSSLRTSLQANDMAAIIFSLTFSLAIMGVTYLVINRILSKVFKHIVGVLSDENIMLLSLGVALVMAFFASFIGLSAAVGAFLGGSIISNLPIRKRVQAIISPLILAFSSYFFVSIGLFVSPQFIIDSLPLVGIFTAVFLLMRFIALTFASYTIGFRSIDAVAAGASMLTMGEFSLLLAKVISPAIKGFDLISMLASMVFLTTLASSALIAKRRSIHFILSRIVPSQITYAGSRIQSYVTGLISRYESSSTCVIKARASIIIILRNMIVIITVFSAALFLNSYVLSHFPDYGIFSQLLSFMPFISVLLVAPLLIFILLELRQLADALIEIFSPDEIKKANGVKSRLFISSFLLLSFFFLFISIPPAVQILKLPAVFSYLNVIPLFGLILILWNGVRVASSIFPVRIIKRQKTQ